MQMIKLIAASTAAAVYMALAAGLVRADRTSNTGGFISLNGMVSGLVTFPIAVPLELIGHRMDFRSNWQMTVIIAICAALVFAVVFGVWSFVQFVGTSTPVPR